MKALFFGSIGSIVETSEIQRQSYNLAFKDLGINWYWNIATYCKLLANPGGKKRLKEYSNNSLDEKIINLIHAKKEEHYENFLLNPLDPRKDVKNIIDLCLEKNINLGFITTTSLKNINSIKHALSNSIDFSNFNIITSIEDVEIPKPNSEIYFQSLKKMELNKNEVYAIEDSRINQLSAAKAGIDCFFSPGEYAMVDTNHNPTYEILQSIKELI